MPQTILTQPEAESVWDPTVLNFDLEESNEWWFDAAEATEKRLHYELFDECGHCHRRVIAQLSTVLSNVCPLQTKTQIIDTLKNNVRFRGAMSKLISDCAQVKILKRIQEHLCVLAIPAWQLEAHQQHQNNAEH